MAQWLICPYWVAERRSRRDDADRVYQLDYQLTELRVTNPTDSEGWMDLVFYEERGDRNYYRADWASGRWSVRPRYQRFYRADPSREYGTSFFTSGWFEIWLSLDAMVIDIEVSAIAKNMISGGGTSAGGVVQNISQRTLVPVRKQVPLIYRLPPPFRPPGSPLPVPDTTPPMIGDSQPPRDLGGP